MNEVLFKTTVMGGFNKSDVLAFIDKQDSQFKTREKELVTRINKLENDLKAETEHGAQLADKIKGLEENLEAERSKCSDSLKRTQEANVEAARVKSDYSSKMMDRDLEIDKLRQEVLTLTHKLEAAQDEACGAVSRAEASEEKLRLIDKTEDQIGRALLEAQKTADNIVNTAKKDAQEIIDKARADADDVTDKARDRVKLIFCDAKDKFCILLSGVEDYKKRIEQTHDDVRSFFSSVDTIFSSMQNTAGEVAEKFAGTFKTGNIEYEVKAETENQAAASGNKPKFDFSVEEENAD